MEEGLAVPPGLVEIGHRQIQLVSSGQPAKKKKPEEKPPFRSNGKKKRQKNRRDLF